MKPPSVATVRSLVRRGPGLLRGAARSRTLGVYIGRGVKLTGPGEYRLHRGARINARARIYVGPGAVLEVKPRARIGERTVINAATSITIGAGTEVSWDVQILDTDFHEVYRPDGSARSVSQPVVLEDKVLVGTGALILKGVTIGANSVVGAGSVVTQDVPAGTVVAGNPARPVAQTSGWH